MIVGDGGRVTAWRDALARDLVAYAFTPAEGSSPNAPRVGAEVELLAVDAATRRPCAVGRTTLPLLRAHGARRGWREERSGKGAPVFHTPGGGRVTLEPGGQVEFSAPPARSASELLAALRETVAPLRAAAAEAGAELMAVGIDPHNPIECAPLQLRAERYARMAEYLAAIDPAGARMMRQTAAFQLSLDLGDPRTGEPARRWRVLNAAAPLVVAIFANSPRYAGAPTGYRSWRAEGWRRLDPSRTGVLPGGDTTESCARAYLDFALAAPAIFRRDEIGAHRPFGELFRGDPLPAAKEWREHLTTLFPEVRPRGYLELRSADSVAPEWYAAPVALLSGVLYHPPALAAAEEVLGQPSPELLRRAGTCALRDPRLAAAAADLAAIALGGCEALGAGWMSGEDLEAAREFFSRYTYRGRSPADDVDEVVRRATGEAAAD